MVLLYFIGLSSNGTSLASQIAFYIIIILAGIPTGFSNIMTYSMIADSIDYLEDKTGERAEGICFSLQTFISKIGMAMTAFVTLMVLGEYGYNAKLAQTAVTDEVYYSEAFQKICEGNWMATTLLCGLSMFACAIPLLFYTFTEDRQNEAVSRVLARKIVAGNTDPTVRHEFVLAVDAIDRVKRSEVLLGIAKIFGLETIEELDAKVEELKAVDEVLAEDEALVHVDDVDDAAEKLGVEEISEISDDYTFGDDESAKSEDNNDDKKE